VRSALGALKRLGWAVADTRSGVTRRWLGLAWLGILNMLDGVASTERRIIFMTTNYLERSVSER
jgi:hypothetical protein